ncbi:MAG TPA: ion transporter, partial [Aggregicoccus sp.]|nr:ion transporter [Aggregicoccus sp.]
MHPFAEEKPPTPLRARLHQIIFEADTPAGRAFDLGLLVAIALSVTAVVLESVTSVRARHGPLLRGVEWAFTLLFTLEYVLRLVAVQRPLRYARSFFGLVDLLAILPTYAGALLPGAHSLLVVRILRLLRVFRILRLSEFLGQAQVLGNALRASRQKITVFLLTVFTITVIMGAVMHLIEGPAGGFESIPHGIYWSIVTLTTVGFGDITPKTVPGQMLASLLMVMGYGIIAVPTGIVSVELAQATRAAAVSNQACPACGRGGHDLDARHCKHCGAA